MTVYFFLAEEVQRVKIGYTGAHTSTSRLASLQVGSPCKLELLFEMSDKPSGIEKKLHKRFDHLRVFGEWFSYSGELKSFLETLITAKNPEICMYRTIFKSDNAIQPTSKPIKSKSKLHSQVNLAERYLDIIQSAIVKGRKLDDS